MLHCKKSQSILQWYNSLTTKDVNSLTQFTDGSHFYEIVASLQPFTLPENKEGNLSESIIFSETSVACNEVIITSVEEDAAEEKMETSVFESGNAGPFVIKESDRTDTQKKYDAIRKFMNGFYLVDSSSFIDYAECQNGKELELAKVAIFLLSAMVQNLMSSKDKIVYNTTLLEPEVQEDIRECLSLVLMGENRIKMLELHKILSRPASYKGTLIRKQPSRSSLDPNELSEGVRNVPKKRKEIMSVLIDEDVQDSPLKSLLESPKFQYNAAIFKKESELAKLRDALIFEENKVMDLTFKKKNLSDELEKKKKELEFYKKQLESQCESFCEKDLSTEELKLKKIEEERVRKLMDTQEEIKQTKRNEALQEKIVELEKKEHNVTATLIEENTKLKDEIQILNLDIEKKSETIKTLIGKVNNLEIDLKVYQQMHHGFPVPNSRKELRSPSTIIYADEQPSRETLDRKEHDLRQDPETKEERIKLLRLQRKSDPSNKNQNLESQQVIIDRLLGDVRSLEKEKSILKEKLKYYELKYGSTTDDATEIKNLNSVKKESDRIGSASKDSGPSTSKSDNKVESQLCTNVSDNSLLPRAHLDHNYIKFHSVKSQLETIIHLLEKKNCIAPALLKKLKEKCNRIRESNEFESFLGDLVSALRQPVMSAIVTRRARAVAAEESEGRRIPAFAAEEVETSARINKNKNLEQEVKALKSNIKLCQVKNDELKMANKKLEESSTELMKEIENFRLKVDKLQQEIAISQDKYTQIEALCKKKDQDVKKSLIMYQNIYQLCKTLQPCSKECKEIRKREKELNKDCLEFEQENGRLKVAQKLSDGEIASLRFSEKELQKENKELKQKLWMETHGLSDNLADRDKVIRYYFTHGKHIDPKAELAKREPEDPKRPKLMFHRAAFNPERASTSSGLLASNSIPSALHPMQDTDDDWLIKDQIHHGSLPKATVKKFPSEEVYSDWSSESDDSEDANSSEVDSDESFSSQVRKRKRAEMVSKTVPVEKKVCRPIAKIIGPKETSAAPLKQAATLRQSVLVRSQFFPSYCKCRVPMSVHKLMTMPRKGKPYQH